jgi:hypothetical protein
MQEVYKNRIVKGYAEWMQVLDRTASKKIEFGDWWRLNTTYWRVSWLEATGELYAVEQRPVTDRFVMLSVLDKKQVTDLMRKWFDGNELEALFNRFVPAPAPTEPTA